jgi:hypothetical protein
MAEWMNVQTNGTQLRWQELTTAISPNIGIID